MSCLNDAQIQSIVDREAGDAVRQHVTSCARCQVRVRERETVMRGIGQAMSLIGDVPPDVSRRVERALAEGSTPGATRLRESRAARWSWLRAGRMMWSVGAVTAATLLAVVFVAPIVRGPATVSAAEILAKSANQLAAQPTTGVELLEYELVLDGVPKEMMPDGADGTYRVQQAIDHDVRGPVPLRELRARRRDAHVDRAGSRRRDDAWWRCTVDGQPYRFEFSCRRRTRRCRCRRWSGCTWRRRSR